jgi:ribosomal-protein-alanine N-acetyltransferase
MPDWRPPIIETPRLILRPLEESDATAVFLYSCNPKMTRFTCWDTHQTLEDSLYFVRDYARSRYREKVPDPLGIILKNDPTGAVIGSVGCFWSSKPDGVMELGYHIAEPFWGRGLTLEAARALVDYSFRNYSIERIHSRVFVGNDASAQVAAKLGMVLDGTLRSMIVTKGRRWDVQIYSILRQEW